MRAKQPPDEIPVRLHRWVAEEWPGAGVIVVDDPELQVWWDRVSSWRLWQEARWAFFNEPGRAHLAGGLSASELFTLWPPGESPVDRQSHEEK